MITVLWRERFDKYNSLWKTDILMEVISGNEYNPDTGWSRSWQVFRIQLAVYE